MEMIIAFVFGVAAVIAFNILRKPKVKPEWRLSYYTAYCDTSYGQRTPSCKFTIVNLTTKEVFERLSYGRQYSQGEIAQAVKDGVAHKLGEKAYL